MVTLRQKFSQNVYSMLFFKNYFFKQCFENRDPCHLTGRYTEAAHASGVGKIKNSEFT